MQRLIFLTTIMYLLMFFGQACADAGARAFEDVLATRQVIQAAAGTP